jgi:Lrp/AsnC family transcriptional regulator for asnA, asnC and gidA
MTKKFTGLRNRTIDETDAKILKMLLQESRTSFTEIAKNCKISVGAVRMRYKQLRKAGIINGEVMLVNPHSLGYKYISDLGITTAIDNEKDVIEFLKSRPYISQIVGPLGKYNIWAKVALHDTQKLAVILQDLESNPHIKHVDTLIWVEAINIEHPENLVVKPDSNANEHEVAKKPIKFSSEEIQINEIDRKIAIILSKNSRTPFRRIAEQLGISTKTVIERYKRLRGNVLTLSTITVDLNKLGYNALANLFIKAANRSSIPRICSHLLQIPNLIVVIRYIGVYDLYAAVVLSDYEELFKLTERIHRIHGIEKTDTFLAPNVPAWPLNLFPSLLETEYMPKFAFKNLSPNS